MFERNFILKALEQARWNVTATARNLGMPLSTLKFKMDRLDIRDDRPQAPGRLTRQARNKSQDRSSCHPITDPGLQKLPRVSFRDTRASPCGARLCTTPSSCVDRELAPPPDEWQFTPGRPCRDLHAAARRVPGRIDLEHPLHWRRPRETDSMRPSAFNLRVPMPDGDVFLMNTLTDAQLVVSGEVVALLDRLGPDAGAAPALGDEEREALGTLSEHGFVVAGRGRRARAARVVLRRVPRGRLAAARHHPDDAAVQLRVRLLLPGRPRHAGRPARRCRSRRRRASPTWIARQVDAVRPTRLVLTFFGGEPLLNVPALMRIAEACHAHAASRGIEQIVSIITNGLLLTPELVDRLLPLGLTGVKVTLDGDRETHDRMRPLRGGQGTFDRIVENVRRVADKVPVAIGGNFDVVDGRDATRRCSTS